MAGPLGTDTNPGEINGATNPRCPNRKPGTLGSPEDQCRVEPPNYADTLYSNALKEHHEKGEDAVLKYIREVDAKMMREASQRDPYSKFMGRAGIGPLARAYGPGAGGLFPMTGMMGDAMGLRPLAELYDSASRAAKRIIRAAEAFFDGLGAGLKAELKSEHFSGFARKLGESSVLSAVFPVVFGSGAAYGIVKDLVDTVKGIIQLAGNIKEIAAAVFDLIEKMLKDPDVARELGRQVGIQLAGSFKKLLDKNVVEFTFELGKIVGPFIVYSLLAFFGIPLGAVVGARVATWFGQLLAKFPKLAGAVAKISRLLPRFKNWVLYGKATKAYIKKSGMPKGHFDAFKQVAKDQNVIAIVRNTNNKSLELIEKFKCPPKAKNLENIGGTSPKTGIVMAEDVDKVRRAGYAVVDADGIPRGLDGKALDLPDKFWKLEKGQVIDVKAKKPVVGDYDLMGILDPNAPGRNIALATKNGEMVKDVTSPIVEKFKGAVNKKFDQPRVLHGAQDQYGGFRGGATVIYPDGSATYLPDQRAVELFYNSPNILRQPRKGQYPQGTAPKFDEHGKWENVQRLDPKTP